MAVRRYPNKTTITTTISSTDAAWVAGREVSFHGHWLVAGVVTEASGVASRTATSPTKVSLQVTLDIRVYSVSPSTDATTSSMQPTPRWRLPDAGAPSSRRCRGRGSCDGTARWRPRTEGANDPRPSGATPERVAARHWYRPNVGNAGSGQLEDVLAAARTKMVAGAPTHAARLFEAALELTVQPEQEEVILLELAAAESRFAPERAIERWRAALPLVAGGPAEFETRLRLVRTLAFAHRDAEAIAECDVLIARATNAEERLRAEVTYVSAARLSLDTRPLGRRKLQRLVDVADARPDSVVSREIYAELAYEYALAGTDHRQVIEAASAALGGEELAHLHAISPPSRHGALLALVWSGELRTAERAGKLLLARARQRSSQHGIAAALAVLVNVAWRRGLAEETAELSAAVVDTGVEVFVPQFRAYRAMALAMLGHTKDTLELLEVPGGERRWSALPGYQGYLYAATVSLLVVGDRDGALRAALHLGTLAGALGAVNPAVLPWRSLAALASLELGRAEDARALAEDDVGLARRFAAPDAIALTLRASAAAATAGQRIATLEEASRFATQTPNALLQLAIDADLRVARAGHEPKRDAVANGPHPEVRVLGDFSVWGRAGHSVNLRGVPGRAIRILIALSRRVHVEELAELLWDEDISTEQARARMGNVISRSGGVLGRDGDLVYVRADVDVDATRFEKAVSRALSLAAREDAQDAEVYAAAASAAGLYAGDLLPSDPYADWAVLPREQLRRRFLTVSDLAAAVAARRGDVDAAMQLIDAAIRHDPYDLDRYDRAVAMLRAAGRRSQASSVSDDAARARRILGL